MTKISEDYIDLHDRPLFILSPEAVLLEANSFAHFELLHGATFSTDRSGKLRLSVNDETKRLHEHVNAIAQWGGPSPRSILRLRHGNTSDRRFLVLRRLMSSIDVPSPNATSDRVIVSVRNPCAPLQLTVDDVASALDLTPTEASIALELANGKRLRQIADIGGSKITTVRWHLASAQRKTGTHSQTELVKLLLSLAH
jgi:DNA-binding CsgD family transcriptional regulator